MLSFLTSLAAGSVKDWLTSRNKIAEAKAQAKAQQVQNGIAGWSDEWLVMVWSYPIVGAFIPQLQPYVASGFEFLSGLPDWYIGGYLSVTAAVFGIDKYLKFKGQ